MAQYIKPGNIFGRIGTGIGKGLAQQLPEEITRSRLASGLKDLAQQKDLSPFEQFARLSAIPGVTPQMIQSGSELLRQQARGEALAGAGNRTAPTPFPTAPQPSSQAPQQNGPSITKGNVLEGVQRGFIPRTEDEKFLAAGQKYNENPAFYGNDPQRALDYENKIDATDEARNNALLGQHQKLTAIQDNVVNRLKNQSDRLQAKIPSELYSRIEDEAIQATKPRSEGGEGLTEQQAMKRYGDKLNDASRDYAKIGEIGNWGIVMRPASESLRSLKDLQGKMEKLGESDNFAKSMIADLKISPILSYAIAQPVGKVEGLNQYINKLKPLEPDTTLFETKVNPNVSIPKTMEIAPALAKFVSENERASPLAIAYELNKKGYDGNTFLQYLTDHANELNLRQRQSEQTSTPINILPPLNDWWLESFTGVK